MSLVGFDNIAPPAAVEPPMAIRLALGLDPGPVRTGYALYRPAAKSVIEMGTLSNAGIMAYISGMDPKYDVVGVEGMNNQGKRVGRETFDACEWVGRFLLRCADLGIYGQRVIRKASSSFVADQWSGDKDVKTALRKRFGKDVLRSVAYEPDVDGKPAKEKPSSHALSALAVAVTLIEKVLKR